MSEDLYVITTFDKNPSGREVVRLALSTFREHRLIDARVCVPLTEAVPALQPTGKGLSLRVELLDDLIKGLQAARTKAVEIGWLDQVAESDACSGKAA